MNELDFLEQIPSADPASAQAVAEALDHKTKPPGSLGVLEHLAIRLAGSQASASIRTTARTVCVFAADHGVSRGGVSAYPREVTQQMVANFAAGGAAINVLARQNVAEVLVADFGVDSAASLPHGVRACSLGPGTRDMTATTAMDRDVAIEGIRRGAALAKELAEQGQALLAIGEMGIGNTTAAAALAAVFCGRPAIEVVGRGTGVDDSGLVRKQRAVERALALHEPSPDDPIGALAAVGGFEIAGLVGLVLGASARRVPVVLDGFITGAAALVAHALVPGAAAHWIAGHQSTEPGHAFVLEKLCLDPVLQLGLRLGEGTGAVLALPLLDAARAILEEMATFESAGVSHE